MKPILKTSLISMASAVIGGVVIFAAVKYNPSLLRSNVEIKNPNRDAIYENILKGQKGIERDFDSLFDEHFFNQNNPFEEMKKMREQMEKHINGFGAPHQSMSNPFDSWFSNKFGGGTINDISKREDADFIYYDIQVDDINATSINTEIKNGYITITGSIEKKNESNEKNGTAQSLFKSTFNRTFPLPEHVDQNKMQMTLEKDKIVLKFPKNKS